MFTYKSCSKAEHKIKKFSSVFRLGWVRLIQIYSKFISATNSKMQLLNLVIFFLTCLIKVQSRSDYNISVNEHSLSFRRIPLPSITFTLNCGFWYRNVSDFSTSFQIKEKDKTNVYRVEAVNPSSHCNIKSEGGYCYVKTPISFDEIWKASPSHKKKFYLYECQVSGRNKSVYEVDTKCCGRIENSAVGLSSSFIVAIFAFVCFNSL